VTGRRIPLGALAVLLILALPHPSPAEAAVPSPGGQGDATSTAGARPDGGESRLKIEIDTRVPAEMVRLIEGRIIDDDSIDAWVDLPGNSELLRQGASRGLDREMLRDNLWHAILGHTARRGRGLGSLAFDPTGDLIRMLNELDTRHEEITRSVVAHLSTYMPDDFQPMTAVVRLHLGGTWDGRTRDDVYLNLSFLHNYAPPWFAGVEGILAHEITHLIHRQFDGPPEDAATPDGLFAVALAQIHSEGIARHIESGLLTGAYPPGTYAAFASAKYQDDLAGFTTALRHTEDLREACLSLQDSATCRKLIVSGLWRGGETYVVGHGMAKAIEAALGRKTLASTFKTGGARFFELYVQATKMLPDLPALSEKFEKALPAADAFLAGRREVWSLRNEAGLAFRRGDYAAAETTYRKLADQDPNDPVAAYNLACTLAREGNEGAALDWLEIAVRVGYADRAFMEKDPDLETLRSGKPYRRFLEVLGSIGSDSPNSSRK